MARMKPGAKSAFFWIALFLIATASFSVDARLGKHITGTGCPANPKLDCSAENPLCNGVYGACPKSPVASFSTPCLSLINTYDDAHLMIDPEYSDGTPVWCRTEDPRVRFTGAGAAQSGIQCKERLVGNDECADFGGASDPRAGRYSCFMKLINKTNVCEWHYELSQGVNSCMLGAASTAASGNICNNKLYGARPDVVCQSTPPIRPHARNAYTDHTGDRNRNDPYSQLTMDASRVLMPNMPFEFTGWTSRLAQKALTGLASFQSGPTGGEGFGNVANKFYSRLNAPELGPKTGNPTTVAQSHLFPTTSAYATYDPKDYRPGQEQKLARTLFEKTPEEVARIKHGEISLLDDARANLNITSIQDTLSQFGTFDFLKNLDNGIGDLIPGMMCKVLPATCHLSSHYDKDGKIHERFYTGLPRDNAINSPSIQHLPDLISNLNGGGGADQLQLFFQRLGGPLGQMVFEGMGLISTAMRESGKGNSPPPTRAQYQQCLSALASNTDIGMKINSAGNVVKGACPERLITCLRAFGGIGERELNNCFMLLNPAQAAQAGGLSGSQSFSGTPVSAFENFISDQAQNALHSIASGGIDMSAINKLLNTGKLGGMGIGDMLNAAGSLVKGGNPVNAMQGLLQSFKQNNAAQIFSGSHMYDARSNMAMFPERDHYSPCVVNENCRVTAKEAPFSLWEPYYTHKDYYVPKPYGTFETGAITRDALKDRQQLPETGPFGSNPNIGLPDGSPDGGAIDIRTMTPFSTPLNATSGDAFALSPDSPLNFGPNPSHTAIGMPETNAQTGPLIFREDGTVYYAALPDQHVPFVVKDIYTAQDVRDGILPQEFAGLVPESVDEPFNELAMMINRHGGIDFMPPEKIQAMVNQLNADFKQSGIDIHLTPEIFQFQQEDIAQLQQAMEPSTANDIAHLLESLGISSALAIPRRPAMPTGATLNANPVINAGLNAAGGAMRDAVRCAGRRDFDQWRVDVLGPRYKRYNSQTLQRITYNRWCYADMLDPKRCTPNRVCAPKSCPPGMPCWSKACWRYNPPVIPPICPMPGIHRGPSPEYPVAAVRFDYGAMQDDIGYLRPINNICGRKRTPLFKNERGDCHFNDRICLRTRAYNCRVYPNGKRYCGYSWTFHPDVKFVLDRWAEYMKGDFKWDAGERHMEDECHHLAMPIPIINKLQFGDIIKAAAAGIRIPEASSFVEFFGPRFPHIALDTLGTAYGQAPNQPQNYYNARGAYIFAMTSSADSPINNLIRIGSNTVNLASQFIKTGQNEPPRSNNPINGFMSARARITPGNVGNPSAPGASLGNQGSSMCCLGGIGGKTGPGCPKSGTDPSFGATELKLLQCRTFRDYGCHCMPQERLTWGRSMSVMAAEAWGANYSMIPETGEESYYLRTLLWPEQLRNNVLNPSNPWPAGGGADALELVGDGDDVLKQGAESAGIVCLLPTGGGGKDKPGLREIVFVTDSNEERKWIDVIATNPGTIYDACGLSSASGKRVARRLYGDDLPSFYRTFYNKHKYNNTSCSCPANTCKGCKNEDHSDMQCYRLKEN